MKKLMALEVADDEIPFRLIEVEGEAIAAVIRMIAIVCFFIIELMNYHGVPWLGMAPGEGMTEEFHRHITFITGGWAISGLLIWGLLRMRVFNPALKYLSGFIDITFLTAILLAAAGPQSPLVIAYFILIAGAVLRANLNFIYFCTGLSIVGFLAVTGYERWYRMQYTIPHYAIFTFVLGEIICGAILVKALQTARKFFKQGLGAK